MCKRTQESKQFNNIIIIIFFKNYLKKVTKLLLVETMFSPVLLKKNSKKITIIFKNINTFNKQIIF
jgi:hypothetical protein